MRPYHDPQQINPSDLRCRPVVLLVLASTLGACHHSDVGSACPQVLAAQAATTDTGDPTVTNTAEIVVQGGELPCESMLCLASEGVRGYCTQKCLDDASCPSGFTCRIVDHTGQWQSTTFCAWKHCDSAADCGGKDFCCAHVSGGSPDPNVKVCSFAMGGACP